MAKTPLAPVVKIDEAKCVNCYACIAECPVKYCMDASKEKVTINEDLCIGCGNCITACHHEARLPVDDTPHFFSDLKHETNNIIAVVAPAVASVFPDTYLNLNGFLQSLGVDDFFDVSFGAELTVVSYLDYIKKKNPKMVIAQPCPAIVSFIEIYHPELIPYLAPTDSPMLHTVKMIHEYYPQYKDHKIAAISPCVAKRREFDETGLVDYNLTMVALKKHLQAENTDLASFPAVEYSGPIAERAAGFSSPGGLLDTAERYMPGIRRKTRKAEGVHSIYPYLIELATSLNDPDEEFPLLIDCLNCEKGCNGGPGTGNSLLSINKLEKPIRKRSAKHEQRVAPKQKKEQYEKYHKLLNQYWKPGLYERGYRNLSENYDKKTPNEAELTAVYQKMKKFSNADIYDCGACGYKRCRRMATAIFNGVNKPENCARYTLAILKEKTNSEELNRQLHENIANVSELIEEMVASISSVSKTLGNNVANVNSLKEASEIGHNGLKEVAFDIQEIARESEGLLEINSVMANIASKTNLLSMNAAIEAAHAGEAGRGFAVVADEIRKLAESSGMQSKTIGTVLKKIAESIKEITNSTDTVLKKFDSIDTGVKTVANQEEQIRNAMEEQGEGSKQVLQDVSNLNDIIRQLRADS